MIREEVIRTSVIQHIIFMRESLDEGITSNVQRTKYFLLSTVDTSTLFYKEVDVLLKTFLFLLFFFIYFFFYSFSFIYVFYYLYISFIFYIYIYSIYIYLL